MKIAVIGGGSTYTPELVKGILEISREITIDEIDLYDINEEKQNIVYDFLLRYVKGRLNLKKRTSVEDAISDADYVVFQFRPGGLKGRELDEKIPLKYGLVGQETTGMGGFSAALRAFPVIEKYVEAVKKYSNAFIVNFTNPSGHITEFVLNYLGYERFVGLCNIPVNLKRHVAEVFSCDTEDVSLKYYGLNHLSFVEKIFVKGTDVTRQFLEKIKEQLSASLEGEFPAWLLDVLGVVPNPYLRYYLMEETMLKKLRSQKLRSQEVMEIEQKLLEIYRKASDIPEELSKRGGSMYSTAAALLIRDLELGKGTVHVLNTKNNGSILNLPPDYVLEIPCYVREKLVAPICQGEADTFALPFVHAVKVYERLTIEAYLKRSKKMALKAILAHPLGPGVEKARELLEEILKANEEFVKLE